MNLHALPTVPTKVRRPDPPESFADVQAYLDRKLEDVESDLGDGETLQSLGIHGTARLHARRATLLDLQWYIGPAVAAEAADRQRAVPDDSVDAAAKEWAALRAEGLDENELRELSGR